MKKESLGKKLICGILSIILAIMILISITIILLQKTVLTKEYVIKVIEKTDTYNQMKYDIEDSFYNYIMQANVEKSQIQDIITQEKIINDINQIISCLYDGAKIEIDTLVIKEEVENRLNDILVSDGNMTLTKESEKSIEEFSKQIAKTYSDNIVPISSNVESIGKVIRRINELLDKYKTVIFTATIVMFIIVTLSCILQKDRLVKILDRYQAIALMISGMFLIIPSSIINLKLDIDNIFIVNKSISNLIKFVVNDLEKNLLTIGIVLIVIGIVVSAVANIKNED